MRHLYLWNTLTLLAVTFSGTLLWADTPVKPSQASFASPFSTKQAVTPPSALETKLLPRQTVPDVVTEPQPAPVDFAIKAASIEVAWLQDPMTYHLHLRADQKPGQDVIVLSGYVPSEPMRNKAVALARNTAGNITIHDELVIQPQMALAGDIPCDPQQAQLVQDQLDKAAPGIGRTLQVTVDSNGVAMVSGRVDELADRRRIIHALQGIPGCTAVRYDLRVPAPGTPAVLASAAPTVISSASPKVAAAGSVKPVPVKPVPVKPAMTPPVEPKKQELSVELAPCYPKLLGSINTAKQASPSIADIEQRAKQVKASASDLVQAGCVEATHQPASKAEEKIISSSLSGLFPPGISGRSNEPVIMLGSPVIVRGTLETGIASTDGSSLLQTSAVIKTADVTKSSTVPSNLDNENPVPIQLNIMPRLAK